MNEHLSMLAITATAVINTLVIAWVVEGGGYEFINKVFKSVYHKVTGKAKAQKSEARVNTILEMVETARKEMKDGM